MSFVLICVEKATVESSGQCTSIGAEFEAQQQGDWNVYCPTCENRAFRAMADDFVARQNVCANGETKDGAGDAEYIRKEVLEEHIASLKM